MSVEFHCTRCSRLLRTPDGSSGRQTQCPECGEVLTVPAAPELALAAPAEVNPYQSPAAAPHTEQAAPGQMVHTRIELGDVLSRGWAIYQSQFGMVVLGVFLAGALSNAPQWLSNIVIQAVTFAQFDQAVIIALQVVMTLGIWAFQIWVSLGQTAYLLHIARGGRPEIGVLFSGSRYFVPAILATLLFGLMFVPAALVCLGPAAVLYFGMQDEQSALIALLIGMACYMVIAIWLSLVFSFYQLAIVDRQCGPVEALSLSRSMTRGNRLTLLALGLIMVVVVPIGLLGCCIGIVFTLAYAVLTGFAVTWLCMTGQATADQYLTSRNAGPIASGAETAGPDITGPLPENPPAP